MPHLVVDHPDVAFHLADILVSQFADFQVDQLETLEQEVVKDEIDIKVLILKANPLLAGDEAEALAEFQKECLKIVDDRLFDGRFAQGWVILQIQELQNVWIADKKPRLLMALARAQSPQLGAYHSQPRGAVENFSRFFRWSDEFFKSVGLPGRYSNQR